MEKPKPKVNAKKFLEDFRAGLGDEELMSLHGLDQKGLNKVLRILVERKLLDESELLATHSFRFAAIPETPSPYAPQRDSVPEPDRPEPIPYPEMPHGTKCPQCGATVSTKVLTCPECGHVLPGEERWANVEPDKRFFERVPPKMLGIILALPVVALMFYVFRDMIIPMAELKVEKQREQFKETLESSRGPIQAAQEVAAKRGLRGLQTVIEQLTTQDIIQSVEPDYSTFVAGPRWSEISTFDKEKHLSRIRSALLSAKLSGEFNVMDQSGLLLARVTKSSMSFGPFDAGSEGTWSSEEKDENSEKQGAEPVEAAGRAKDFLRRSLERRLGPPAKLPGEP
jgi:hypothetical protein